MSRRSDHTISAWPAMLQIIMISTTCTGSSSRWNSMAPQIAEKAKPATLDVSAAMKTAAIAHAETAAGFVSASKLV